MKQDGRVAWQRADLASLDLANWKVTVVGGTGGLGCAISRTLASRGARVTVVGQTMPMAYMLENIGAADVRFTSSAVRRKARHDANPEARCG